MCCTTKTIYVEAPRKVQRDAVERLGFKHDRSNERLVALATDVGYAFSYTHSAYQLALFA